MYSFCSGNPNGKTILKPRHRMAEMDFTDLAQDRDMWQALANR
jgi:hypothetical protein